MVPQSGDRSPDARSAVGSTRIAPDTPGEIKALSHRRIHDHDPAARGFARNCRPVHRARNRWRAIGAPIVATPNTAAWSRHRTRVVIPVRPAVSEARRPPQAEALRTGSEGPRRVGTPCRRRSKVTSMDFAMSAKAQDYHKRLSAFMTEFVFPAEAEYERYRAEKGPDDHTVPPVIEELKTLARERGLWNLFLPAGVRPDERRVRAAGRADGLEHGASRRKRPTARRPTPATWRPCTCSPPSSSASSGWSRCWPARSAARSR